jgi:tetraprenyl-beta-curcumene synthase
VCLRVPSARRTSRSSQPAGSNPRANPARLTCRQLCAVVRAAFRELTWGLPAVRSEVRRWRTLAERIPEGPLRQDALDALERKRGQTDGAALFSILPRRRNRSYLRFLAAYQIIWDYLDSVSERGAAAGIQNGRQLHLALVDAVDPDSPRRDYYRFSPWREDGGYLQTLVDTCRECCRRLPSFERVQAFVLRDAMRAQVLALNHEPDPALRDAALRAWTAGEFPAGHEAVWYELSGAASAGLAAFALLALACEPSCEDEAIACAHAAYFPWVSAVACMLDSYADQAEDEANGDHSYVAHYPTPEIAVTQTCRLVRRCMCELSGLANSEAHLLISGCMVALYLSKDSARESSARRWSRELAHAGGPLTRVLLPVLRLWRAAYSLHSS